MFAHGEIELGVSPALTLPQAAVVSRDGFSYVYVLAEGNRIALTTVAMGAGMMPVAIGLGTDPSFRAPMAIVVIGGLITSTFLSLLVIPAIDAPGRSVSVTTCRRNSSVKLRLLIFKRPLHFQADTYRLPPAYSPPS